MNITFPVYIRQIKGTATRRVNYHTSLLFFPEFCTENESLQRALSRLRSTVKKQTDLSGSLLNHERLAGMVFNPDLKTVKQKLTLKVGGDYVTCKFFFVIVDCMGTRFAFCPDTQCGWFEINQSRSDSLEPRASEVLTSYFNQAINDHRQHMVNPQASAYDSARWITTIGVDVRTRQVTQDETASKMQALWSNEEVNGAQELNKTGRCLDTLYPDDLGHAIGRDRQAELLQQLLESDDRRPVLLLGGHLVGKTALVHEVVRRRIEARGSERQQIRSSSKRNVWLLAPQRLIAGMSYVGQWENRVLAILSEAAQRDHVLYFDDLIGLFRAGQSRDSSLCVADLLKPVLQDRAVRVLAEITPQAFDVLSELDRSFAEHFHVVRVEPTSREQTWQVATSVVRDLEFHHNCVLGPAAIAKSIELQRQYAPNASFPGKAVRFLRQLAIKLDHVSPSDVIREFCETAGVAQNMVDDERNFDRAHIHDFFQSALVGQRAAVEACADVILTAKTRLNPPGKPLATLLFPGPTGVGKTECAKQLAKFLFRGSERLLRFDLNEFKTSYSAARLLGTCDQPEGLLTGAVRRQPFCVVLLDEIEKAHPDVFDILLQVIGEGRLTDSQGRTTDFSNALIIMTSNLGTRRAGQAPGFIDSGEPHDYIAAAEKFFRPEFFNRIDRIVPFHPLDQPQISRIAGMLMNKVVAREGIVRRRCILQVGAGLINRLVEQGYHPDLGARAMKRAIEAEFTQPVANRLAMIRSDVPTVIEVNTVEGGDNVLKVQVHELNHVEPTKRPAYTPDYPELIRAARQCVDRLRDQYFSRRPQGEISTSGMNAELIRHFALREQADSITDLTRGMLESIKQNRADKGRPAILTTTRKRSRNKGRYGGVDTRRVLVEINSVDDVHQFVNETFAAMEQPSSTLDPVAQKLIDQCAMLQSMCQNNIDQAMFFLQIFDSDTRRQSPTADDLHSAAALLKEFTHRVTDVNSVFRYFDYTQFEKMGFEKGTVTTAFDPLATCSIVHLKGDGLGAVLEQQTGTSLYCDSSGKLSLIKTGFIPPSDPGFATLVEMTDGRDKWQVDELPKPVFDSMTRNSSWNTLRMFDYRDRVIDFRTGTTCKISTPDGMTNLIHGGLTLPDEFSQFCQ